MDLHSLRYFVIVAEELHVTRAAECLNIAQPALSRIIHHLEEDLGFALFDRSNKRQLALTPAGQIFWEHLSPALAQYETAVQMAQRIARGEVDKLVVGYTAAAMFAILPAIIQAYQGHPEVHHHS